MKVFEVLKQDELNLHIKVSVGLLYEPGAERIK